MSQSSSKISNSKFHRSWDIIPSSLLNAKFMNFNSAGKVDTGLLVSPPKKIGMSLLSNLMRGNIEETPRIICPLNYGEDDFLPFTMDRRTHRMKPSPYTPFLQQNIIICIELSVTPSLQATNNYIRNSTICVYSSSEKDK